jgi:hypothetical protein
MRLRIAVAFLLAAPLASATFADPVRMFAVGHKLRLDDVVTYQTFHDKMAALMDATFPGRSGLVQSGVDDVASHLAPVDPAAPPNALVVFPEDTGLTAAFIGTRGDMARAQPSSTFAIIKLAQSYAPLETYYQTKFPGQPALRYLVLALTDTFYRSVYETFSELATTHGVYLAVSANLAPAHRVEASDNAALVDLLRDPDEPSRTYAYEATSPFPHNTTFVFAPDGQVLVPDGSGGVLRAPSQTGGALGGSTDKAYLTPIEQPPPGSSAGLALGFGAVRDMEVLPTPVGRLGIVISKDAWMVDVNDRYVAKGANVILQPEAFDSWAFTTSEWSPDVFKEGGYANLQKNPTWVTNVDASMTGNLFEITFDGQSAILGRKRKTDPGALSAENAWVGQNPDTGFVRIGPWIEDDPGIANGALSLPARRNRLVADGVLLEPGSGVPCGGSLVVGACENGYREAIVWTDVDVPTSAVTAPIDLTHETPPHFSDSVRASGTTFTPIARHAPRVAARGRHVFVTWYQDDGPGSAVYLAVSHDGGQTFQPEVRVSDNPSGSTTELNPAIAVRGSRILVTWQEFDALGNDDAGHIVIARFDAKGRKRTTDVRVDDAPGVGKWMPSVAFSSSVPLVAWIDERDAGPEGEPLEHVYVSRGDPTGTNFAPAVRVDAGADDPLALHNDNKWAPSIATWKRNVYVVWADFRNANWDIFSARSLDRGFTFQPNVRVDDYPNLERLNERPAVAVDPLGAVQVAWTDLRARQPDTNIFYAKSSDFGQTFTASTQLDDSKQGFVPNTDTPTNQWAPALATDRGRLYAAWQDNRLGNDDVFFTSSVDGGATFAADERVDDTGDGPSEQTRPSLALGGKGAKRICYVAWEDNRSGASDIYVARRSCGE